MALYDIFKDKARSAASAVYQGIDQGRTDLANQRVAANVAAAARPITPATVAPQTDPRQDAYNKEMLGKPMRAGRGRRKGQMVVSGGRYSGRTPDEIYAMMQKNGSGPGGGLRTGSLSQGSGIDWLKANRTTGADLAQQERNVGQTGDRFKSRPAPVMGNAGAVASTTGQQMAPKPQPMQLPVVSNPVAKFLNSGAMTPPTIAPVPSIAAKPAVMPPSPAAVAQAAPVKPPMAAAPSISTPSSMGGQMPMTAAPTSVNANPISLMQPTKVSPPPAIVTPSSMGGQMPATPRPVTTNQPAAPAIPQGLARTPAYVTPAAAPAPVAGQRVAQGPNPVNEAEKQANLKRVQAQMAAQGTAIAKAQADKRRYMTGK